MTLASALLIVLEPAPATPAPGISLLAVDQAPAGGELLFDTTPPPSPQRWSALAIHFSGSAGGSARTLHRDHQRMGLGGLAYHFVVGNGRGMGDGQIEIGYRWRHQLDGMRSHGVTARAAEVPIRPVIDICLIGDGHESAPTDAQVRQLVWLTQQLQEALQITAEQVAVDEGPVGPTRFPLAMFRHQLLMVAGPASGG